MEKMNKNQAIFVAHRGYSEIAPENTIPAFKEAIVNRFDGVECDIWELSKSEAEIDSPDLMIMHDESLHRMCGVNKQITQLDRTQLAEYPVIRGNNIDYYGGKLSIPSYEEYLDLFSGQDTIPIIEIKSKKPRTEKNAISDKAAGKVLRLLAERGLDRRVVIQSFNRWSLHQVLRIKQQDYPDMNLTTLFLTSSSGEIKENLLTEYKKEGISGICISDKIASSSAIKLAKQYELKVGVWVVDDTTRAHQLTEIDRIDYLISNKKLFV